MKMVKDQIAIGNNSRQYPPATLTELKIKLYVAAIEALVPTELVEIGVDPMYLDESLLLFLAGQKYHKNPSALPLFETGIDYVRFKVGVSGFNPNGISNRRTVYGKFSGNGPLC